MSKTSLPCIKCGKPLENIEESADNQPYCGTEFISYGHYGSTIHDEVPNDDRPAMLLVVNICDTCILRAVETDVIQSRLEDNSIVMAHHHLDGRAKAWVLAQNEKKYGSAWGDDQPVDYRAKMLESGWPKELLDKEEHEEVNLTPVTVPLPELPRRATEARADEIINEDWGDRWDELHEVED